MQFRSIPGFILALGLSASALAHDYKTGDLRIDHPYARATVPHQPNGGAYLTIENTGTGADKLIAASSSVAKSVEIHTMSMEGNVMKMREVPGIDIGPSARIAMQPGHGYHLMLMGLKQQLKSGDKFPLTLTFEKAGKLEVSVQVEATAATPARNDVQKHGKH